MKPKIAVIYGGFSSEHDISVSSGQYIASVIDRSLFDVYKVHLTVDSWIVDGKYPVDKSDFSFNKDGQKINFDAAVIVIHGTPGEDGRLQAYFDLIGLPYVSCNSLGANLTFNKFYCNHYLKNFGINIAPSIIVRPDDTPDPLDIENQLGLPVFVKPNAGGSSFGTTKVKNVLELLPAIELARQESDEVIIESFIKGREITVGVVQYNGKVKALTPCEVRSKNEFFDYEAKYNPELNEEIIPAPIPESKRREAASIAAKIYGLLNCCGIVRVDLILSEKDNKFYFLELNSVPGMTSASIVPKMLRHDNIDITELYTQLIMHAIGKKH